LVIHRNYIDFGLAEIAEIVGMVGFVGIVGIAQSHQHYFPMTFQRKDISKTYN